MEGLNADSDVKELNDSGLGQDESLSNKIKISENGYTGSVELLDLSDDVLLNILKYCSAQELKALGFSCTRLAALILDRTLWQRVNATTAPVGIKRMRWLIRNCLTQDTTYLKISGFAKSVVGCPDYSRNRSWEDEPPCNSSARSWRNSFSRQASCIMPTLDDLSPDPELDDNDSNENDDTQNGVKKRKNCCPVSKYTINIVLMHMLTDTCPKLHTLELQYCNIDCYQTGMHLFPPTLKRLSLLGTKCFDQCYDRSFLFKVQDFLPILEELDLSYCSWVKPSCMLPLSKLPSLKKLYMRRCPRLTEFVAYASLATRYGFHKLEVVDLRESPVGDSEVSSFGWVKTLVELYASPAPEDLTETEEVTCEEPELEPWEEEEPVFFKNRRRDADAANPSRKPGGGSKHRRNPSKKDDDDDDQGPPSKKSRPCYCIIDTGAEKPLYSLNMVQADIYTENNSNDPSNNAMRVDFVPPDRNIFPIDQFKNVHVASGICRNASSKSYDVNNTKRVSSAMDASEPTASTSNSSNNKTIESEVVRSIEKNTNDNGSKSKNSQNTQSEEIKYTSKVNEGAGTSQQVNENNTTDKVNCGAVNEGAGTSKDDNINENEENKPKCVRIKRNYTPDFCCAYNCESPNNGNAPEPNARAVFIVPPIDDNAGNGNVDRIPRNSILYVNVGRRVNNTYSWSFPTDVLNNEMQRILNSPQERVDPSSYVSDSTVYRFGRSDSEPQLTYIQIGVNAPPNEAPGIRPSRSNLRVLSLTGYTNITNRSLIHLATAAPHLTLLDLTGTRVTRSGVENFKGIRPDCEVIWNEVEE